MLTSLLGARIGATVAGVTVGLGGAAVAAWAVAGAPARPDLPQPVPAAVSTTRPPTPTEAVGPDATGPAAHGLCNAWAHHEGKQGPSDNSVAFRNLARAAGGEARIAAYCATVPHPGQGADRANPGEGQRPTKSPKPGRTAKPAKPTKAPGSTRTPSPTTTGTAG